MYCNVTQGGVVMPTIAIRVSEKEKEWLSYIADFYGIILSERMKKYAMKQLNEKSSQH